MKNHPYPKMQAVGGSSARRLLPMLLGPALACAACDDSSKSAEDGGMRGGPLDASPPAADEGGPRDGSAAGGETALVDGGTLACIHAQVTGLKPSAARFSPGTKARLNAEVQSHESRACEATLRLRITELGRVVHTEDLSLTLASDEPKQLSLEWMPPRDDYTGYAVELSTAFGRSTRWSALDVSSSPFRYPRYGYLSAFPPDQSAESARSVVDTLTREYYFNLIQFYDWFYRHEDLLPHTADGGVEPRWEDLFGRAIAWETVEDLVAAVHDRNAYAMAYVAMYAAREGYEQKSGVKPAWGLFQTPAAEAQVALAFGGDRYLFLFDPSNPQWIQRMASEYGEALVTGGFDGVQIDQFGPRPTLYRADGSKVELKDTFVPFLTAIDAALEKLPVQPAACVFNLVDGAVGGYAVEEVATSPACDFLYSEIWFTNDTYESLRAYIDELRRIGRGRSVVLAVYPQYGEDVGIIMEAENAALQGVSSASAIEGFSGTGYVTEFDAPGDSITWSLSLDEASLVSFVFRYSNASGMAATRTLFVDGERAGQLRFGSLAKPSDWSFDAWLQTRLSAGKHDVQLRYADQDSGGVAIDRMTLGEFDEHAVRLQNAVLFASGATPILVGDDEQSLAHEYFPNRSKSLRPSLRRALKAQFGFITANEQLLFGPDVVPIEGRSERLVALSDHQLITEGQGGLWTVLRHTPVGDVLHFVNLVGVDDARWRNAAPAPTPQTNVRLRYALDVPDSVEGVLWGSPEHGTALSSIPFERRDGAIELELPTVDYWSLVLLKTQAPDAGTSSAPDAGG